MPLNVAAKRVCEGGTSLPLSISERNSMCHFLNLLIETRPIPHSLCDLQDGSLLEQYKQGMVIVECHDGKCHLLSGSISKERYYLIQPYSTLSSSAGGHYIIFVVDPVAVMHIIIRGGHPMCLILHWNWLPQVSLSAHVFSTSLLLSSLSNITPVPLATSHLATSLLLWISSHILIEETLCYNASMAGLHWWKVVL